MHSEITSLAQAEQALYELMASAGQLHGRAITIDRTKELANLVDNPQDKLNVIHVAGTSGKGSTCYAITSRLLAAGVKVGTTVSPHIFSITERVQIDGVPLSDERFISYFNDFIALVRAGAIFPTYYEFMLVFALWVFAREDVDYAVVETGLGGTHDSSNICRKPNKICVLLDIGLDHTDFLGTTLPEIAAQKAGIIAPGNAVIARRQSEEVNEVFVAVAQERHAKITWVNEQLDESFVVRNRTMADAVYRYIAQRDELAPLEEMSVNELNAPGRMSTFELQNSTIVIVDGAHNPQKITALLRSLQLAGHTKLRVIVAMKQSKDVDACIELLAPFTEQAIATGFSGEQDTFFKSVPAGEIKELFARRGVACDVAETCTAALKQFTQEKGAPILVVGSLYICGEALSWAESRPMME